MENNKAGETTPNSTGGAVAGQTVNGNGGANPDSLTIPNPKLGMAPLSSELAVAAASNNIPAETQPPSNPPPQDPLQLTDPQNTRTPIPPTADLPWPDPAVAIPPQVSTTPVPSEPEQAPQANDPPLSIPAPTGPPSDPTPTVDPAEQPRPPNPNPTPSGLPPADSPTVGISSRPHNTGSAPE